MHKQTEMRVTPTSKRGRSLISPGREHRPHAIPQEIRDWNAQVDAKKAQKKLAKKLQG